MSQWVRYTLAVVGYIVLGMFTKHYLTWTYGPIYFIVVLEVLPRLLYRIRYRRAAPRGDLALPAPHDS
jgi:hypothetical protein